MSEGFAFKIRKVVTGGYMPSNGERYVRKETYYVVSHKGRRIDSALKLSRALELVRRAGLRLLREEIEHDTRCA